MEASAAQYPNVKVGQGYAVGHLDDLGDGPGFRKVRNVGDTDAIYLCAGGKDGYIGRDGRAPEGEQRVSGPPGAAGAKPVGS